MFMSKVEKQKPNTPAKQCVVRYKGNRLMEYDPETKGLYVPSGQSFYLFPSKHKANSAVHHQIEADKAAGKFEPWNDYEVLET